MDEILDPAPLGRTGDVMEEIAKLASAWVATLAAKTLNPSDATDADEQKAYERYTDAKTDAGLCHQFECWTPTTDAYCDPHKD